MRDQKHFSFGVSIFFSPSLRGPVRSCGGWDRAPPRNGPYIFPKKEPLLRCLNWLLFRTWHSPFGNAASPRHTHRRSYLPASSVNSKGEVRIACINISCLSRCCKVLISRSLKHHPARITEASRLMEIFHLFIWLAPYPHALRILPLFSFCSRTGGGRQCLITAEQGREALLPADLGLCAGLPDSQYPERARRIAISHREKSGQFARSLAFQACKKSARNSGWI